MTHDRGPTTNVLHLIARASLDVIREAGFDYHSILPRRIGTRLYGAHARVRCY
jgi:hypothetical protein